MNNPIARELQRRLFELAASTIAFVRALPRGTVEYRLGGQLIDSGSSVPAQYRAACRAQSTPDFIAKVKKLEEEADESALWLALLRATGLPDRLNVESERLEREFSEVTAIAVASARTARARVVREKAARELARRRAKEAARSREAQR